MAGIYLGKNAILAKDILPANTNQALAILRLNQELANPNYVSLYLSQQSMIDYINNMSGQSAQPNVNFEEIKSIEIILPPLPEQTTIASVISSLDDKIDLLHRQNATLEKMAETLFRQWFVEEAKEEWGETILANHTEVFRGLSYKGNGLTEIGLGLPMHNLNSVYEGGGYKYEGIKFYNGEFRERHLVNPGDIIVTNTEQGHDGFDVPMYNGNISGVKWKSSIDDDRMAFGYTYDKLNRIVTTDYVKGTDPDNWQDEGYYNMQIRGAKIGNDTYEPGYDLNGNILTLKRWGVVDEHESMIDDLTYDYSGTGNQVKRVDDAIDVTENDAVNNPGNGFKDGKDLNGDGKDYVYDANGNMLSDDNKEIEEIKYNFLNLPMVVDMTNGRKIKYIYDASGIKRSQHVFEDETLPATRTTDYVGEMVYETKVNDARELKYIQHEEGRVLPGPEKVDPDWTQDGQNWEYQYYLKDHLGNTRVTLGRPKTFTYLATMEADDNRIIEESEDQMGFTNITATERNFVQLDHTHLILNENGDQIMPDASYVSFLYRDEVDWTSKIVIGPAKSMKVLPGDVVEIEAWSKYLHVESYDESVPANLLLTGFVEAFGASGEFLKRLGYVDEGLLAGLENINGLDLDGVPRAYINYILYDKFHNVLEGKKLQINEDGKIVDADGELDPVYLGPHQHMLIDPISIAEEGYIYIYLSNETPNSEVFFDDLTITHTQTNVIQRNDYYPFGLSIDALTTSRDNSLKNKWTFQGQEVQGDFDLGWYAFKWRNHQPETGRFFNIDPLASDYYYNSTYAFSENRVIDGFELEGAERLEANTYKSQKFLNEYLRVMTKDDVLFNTGVKPFMSGINDRHYIYVVNNNGKGWISGADGATHFNKSLINYAERFIYIRNIKTQLEQNGQILDEIQEDEIKWFTKVFGELGISPYEVMRRHAAGYIQDVVEADDLYTLSHELILHESDIVDNGKEDTSTGEEHIIGFGKDFYQKNGGNVIVSPEREEVDPASKMGTIYNKMDKVINSINDEN